MTYPNRIYYPTRELYASLLRLVNKGESAVYQYDKQEPVKGKITGELIIPHLSEATITYSKSEVENMLRKGIIKQVME